MARKAGSEQLKKAAPKPQVSQQAQPIDHGEQRTVQEPPRTGAHLDAPSAVQHPGAGQSSGAVKSDTRVQS